MTAGIYLIVEFDWPTPFEDSYGRIPNFLAPCPPLSKKNREEVAFL